jgi:DNA-binding transcriptional LysR family regulator
MISRRVRHALAVADTGSFSRAAELLGIGQPPLSQSVQRLEQELGVTLFERTPKGVRLTPSGEAFLTDARQAVAAADRARSAARAAAIGHPPVRIGVILPAIFGPLQRLARIAAAADVPIQLIDGGTEELLEALGDGRLDLSFVAPPFDTPPGMRLMPIDREPLVAALPESMAAAPGPHAPLAAMAERLIMPPRSYGPMMYDALLTMFTLQGLKPVVVAETTRMLTMLALTSAGVGASIVPPSFARSVNMADISFRPFAPDVPTPTFRLSIGCFDLLPTSPAGRLAALLGDRMRAD